MSFASMTHQLDVVPLYKHSPILPMRLLETSSFKNITDAATQDRLDTVNRTLETL